MQGVFFFYLFIFLIHCRFQWNGSLWGCDQPTGGGGRFTQRRWVHLSLQTTKPLFGESPRDGGETTARSCRCEFSVTATQACASSALDVQRKRCCVHFVPVGCVSFIPHFTFMAVMVLLLQTRDSKRVKENKPGNKHVEVPSFHECLQSVYKLPCFSTAAKEPNHHS